MQCLADGRARYDEPIGNSDFIQRRARLKRQRQDLVTQDAVDFGCGKATLKSVWPVSLPTSLKPRNFGEAIRLTLVHLAYILYAK